jgi:hypothetical protein
MVKRLLIGTLAIASLALAVVATRPGEFRIERSTVIEGPAEAPFMKVVIFRRWSTWSPWAALDPGMEVTYSGPRGGVGSGLVWNGAGAAGQGRMTMTAALKDQLVRIAVEFERPLVQSGTMEFRFQQQERDTRVTWSFHGTRTFLGRVRAIFADPLAPLGPEMEKGLDRLKERAEQ